MKAKVMNAMQSFSKALMGPVLFLPIAGMLQALSSVMCNTAFVSEGGILYTAGKFINGGVSAVIGNLGILFCVGVSMSLAKKKKADAAFVSLVSYLIWLSSLLPKREKGRHKGSGYPGHTYCLFSRRNRATGIYVYVLCPAVVSGLCSTSGMRICNGRYYPPALHSFGNLEFITRIPMSVKAGLTGDLINFVICVVAFFVIGYVVAYFMIGKFHFATPGRLGNYTDDGAEEEDQGSTQTGSKEKKDSQAERIMLF